MAFLNEAFDVNELPQGNTGNFEPLAAGWYTVTITQAELKDTKAGTGQYIKLRYNITGPTHQGRHSFPTRRSSDRSEERREGKECIHSFPTRRSSDHRKSVV